MGRRILLGRIGCRLFFWGGGGWGVGDENKKSTAGDISC